MKKHMANRFNFRFPRFLFAVFTSFLLLFHYGMSYPAGDKHELSILTWSEYIDPEIVEEFEAKHNVKIKFTYYETDDTRTDILLETDGLGYDLVLVNGAALSAYQKRGWLAAISKDIIPNIRHIDRRWIEAFPMADGWGVPYFWGTLGIAYRSDLVDKPIHSWMDLFRPEKKLQGRIVMIKSSRDIIGAALQALGHSINSTDNQVLKQAEALLLEQKPHVSAYSYVDLHKDSVLVSGEVVAAMIYNGDAMMVREHNENIVYVVPSEGSNLWVDYWVLMRSSAEKELAMAFINFTNQPEIAARMAAYVHYATPNLAAESLLPAEFLRNPVIYPDDGVLERSEVIQELPLHNIKKRNTVFSRVIR
jgi:spermidine/putrescine transport system substrate-binding protein